MMDGANDAPTDNASTNRTEVPPEALAAVLNDVLAEIRWGVTSGTNHISKDLPVFVAGLECLGTLGLTADEVLFCLKQLGWLTRVSGTDDTWEVRIIGEVSAEELRSKLQLGREPVTQTRPWGHSHAWGG